MRLRIILNCCFFLVGTTLCRTAYAQEGPLKRLAGVVAVAVAEYRLGVDSAGKIIAQLELDEARDFFIDARDIAGGLTGENAGRVRALVDTLDRAIRAVRPSGVVDALYTRLHHALGPEAAIDFPSRDFDPAAGQLLYAQNCASCHGIVGLGDGPAAAGLVPPPAPLAGPEARAIAPALMYHVISVGVKGTAMAPWADRLSADQRWDLVGHVNSLRSTADDIEKYLTAAREAAKQGRFADATERAFNAYAAFEPMEAIVKGRDPNLVARLEGEFLAFRGAVRTGDLNSADSALKNIRAELPQAIALATGSTSPWQSFFESFLIILREGFEAILIIGAIVAMLTRTNNARRVKEVWIGAGLGVVASAIVAVILQTTLRLLPATREVIEGVTILVAVVVLFSVSYWILSKVEAKHWQAYVHEKVHAAVAGGGRAALVGVAFLVVFREGAETALFYQALLQNELTSMPHIFGGIALGALVLTGLYMLLNVFGVRLPLRAFFAVTGTLLYIMAFVFMGKGLRELQEGGVLSNTPLAGLPTIHPLGIYPSIETLAGQWILLGLFALALWHTFMTPRLQSRKSQGARAR